MNSALVVGTAALGVLLWLNGGVSAAAVATALPLAWQIANMAGWVSWEVSGIFENITSCRRAWRRSRCRMR